jgi:hypothetical protein
MRTIQVGHPASHPVHRLRIGGRNYYISPEGLCARCELLATSNERYVVLEYDLVLFYASVSMAGQMAPTDSDRDQFLEHVDKLQAAYANARHFGDLPEAIALKDLLWDCGQALVHDSQSPVGTDQMLYGLTILLDLIEHLASIDDAAVLALNNDLFRVIIPRGKAAAFQGRVREVADLNAVTFAVREITAADVHQAIATPRARH